jgi:hypothetical protein
MKALGMIEVYGLLAAVEALDAALKAANVSLLGVTKVTGGLVCVKVTGDVGATKAAMDASAAAAAKVGKVISVHVIPRPSSSIEAMLSPKGPDPGLSGSGDAGGGNRGQKDGGNDSTPPAPDTSLASPAIPDTDTGGAAGQTESGPDDDLVSMTVVELRAMARDIGITSMSKRDIRFAKKEELLTAIRNFREQGS